MGFTPEDFDRPSETFSGGWQMRIALAKLLLGRPGLLLLDEPTNHLDLDARNWLEEYLSGYPHAVILVSHDRFFLDAVVTRITEIGLRKLTDYTGNYTDYLVEREARMERLRQQKRDQDDEIARMDAFINRFRYQATKAAQVQSRIKMRDKIVPLEIPPERKRVRFTFPACAKSGRTVLDLRGVRKAYGPRVVFGGINVHIERGDRIALIGPNGAGKSTLMRMLSGVEAPDAGTRTEGHQVVTQYFAQDEATRLDPTLTVYQTLAGDAPLHMVPSIRNILGGFLFSGDDVDKPVRVLSGGERTRLAVARMLLRPSNTLLLDEPTNHLDLDSKDVLLEALEDFGGTLIFVSHDRYFVDKLATKVIDIGAGEALIYPGNYEEFLWSRKQQQAAPPPPAAKAPARPRGRAAGENRSGGRGRQGARAVVRGSEARRERRPPGQESGGRPAEADRRPGEPDCREGTGHPRHRNDDVGPGVLRQSRNREADYRSAPGVDVGSRGPDAPMGAAPADGNVIGCQSCNHGARTLWRPPGKSLGFPVKAHSPPRAHHLRNDRSDAQRLARECGGLAGGVLPVNYTGKRAWLRKIGQLHC